MGRMIDTDSAYAVLTDYYHHSTDTQHAALREALGRVESVDAEPVVHGHWTDDTGIEGAWNYCSVCGEQAIDLYDYCPNCGAKMDGKDDDHEKAD